MANVFINPNYNISGDGTSALLAATPGAPGAFNTWVGITLVAGNSYLQRRGTIHGPFSVLGNGTKAAPCVMGAYSNDTSGVDDNPSLPNPIFSSSTSAAALTINGKVWINVINIDTVSTYPTGVALGPGFCCDCTFTNMTCTAPANPVYISSSSYGGGHSLRRLTFNKVTAIQTGGAVNGYSAGFFLNGYTGQTGQLPDGGTSVLGGGIDGIDFIDCTVAPGAYQGWYGSTNSVAVDINSSIRNVRHIRCTVSYSLGMAYYYTPSSGQCIDWNNAALGGNTDPWIYNICFDGCQGIGSGNANVSVISIGGYCKNSKFSLANTVVNIYQSTTAGAQFICNGYLIYNNDMFYNITKYGADGCGIFLDINTAFVNSRTPTTNVWIIRNRTWGQLGGLNNTLAKYLAAAGPSYVTDTSSGIRTYMSKNCVIAGNLCYGNAGGIGIDGYSMGMTVVNNTCADNWGPGLQITWTQPNSGNIVKNNIFLRNYAGVWAGWVGDLAGESTGSLTLSQTGIGGGVTATTVNNNFGSGHNINYGIRELGGNGFAIIYSVTNANVALVDIRQPFSSTTPTWTKTGGATPDAYIGGNNLYYGNTYDLLVGAADTTTLTKKTGDISGTDPLLETNGKPLAGSPVIGTGKFVGYNTDAEGKQFYNPPSIGAYEYLNSRSKKN